MKPKVYLAGPITGLNYQDATEWRRLVTMWLEPDIAGFSPLRRKDYLKDEVSIKDTYDAKNLASVNVPDISRAAIMSNQRAIYSRDYNDVITSQAIIVNLLNTTKVSIGTVMEIAWADQARIPVILVMEEKGNIHEHSMLREASSFRVDNIEWASDIARSLLLP